MKALIPPNKIKKSDFLCFNLFEKHKFYIIWFSPENDLIIKMLEQVHQQEKTKTSKT
jgi:hypothetical protein